MSTPPKQSPPSDATPPLRDRRTSDADRRALTWRTFLMSGLAPRRRGGRRAGDRESLVDFHEPFLMVLAIVMLVLSVVDGLLTVTLMTDGAQEANPLLKFVLDEHPRLFAVTKIALTGAGVVLLVVMARATLFKLARAKALLQALVAAYAALVVYEAWLLSTMFRDW